MSTSPPARRDPQPDLPPILAGTATPEIRSRLEKFFHGSLRVTPVMESGLSDHVWGSGWLR